MAAAFAAAMRACALDYASWIESGLKRRRKFLAARLLAEFNRDLTKTEEMCRKVKGALQNIETRREKFPHIDDRELGSRKASIDQLDQVRRQPTAPDSRPLSRRLAAALLDRSRHSPRARSALCRFPCPLAARVARRRSCR